MNQLEVTGLRTKTRIGVYPWEQRILQELVFDIIIPLEGTAKDDLANTIDYEKLCREVTTTVESQAFRLVETVAEHVIELIQTHFNVSHLTLRVSKPNAIANAGNISILMSK